MKYEWEPQDLTPGRVIRNAQTNATNNKYMICSVSCGPIMLVSLSDGLCVIEHQSRKEMVRWMNERQYEPTDDDRETVRAIDYLRGQR